MSATAVEQCSVEQLVQALNRRKSPGPTSLEQIRKALPKPLRQCDDALAEALRVGVVWKYGVVRGHEQYWTEPPSELAWKLVERMLCKKPADLTKAQLLKIAMTKEFTGVLDAGEWIQSLVSSGRLFPQVQTGKSKSEKYTRDQYDFVNRLIDEALAKVKQITERSQLPIDVAMERVRSRLAFQEQVDDASVSGSHAGSNRAPLFAPESLSPAVDAKPPAASALRTSSDEISSSDGEVREQILQAMREINPRADEGSLIFFKELRARLDFQPIEKSRFDRILLDLYRTRQVVLYKTSAGQLTDDERRQFVTDADGNFYNAVSFWRE